MLYKKNKFTGLIAISVGNALKPLTTSCSCAAPRAVRDLGVAEVLGELLGRLRFLGGNSQEI